MSRGGDTLVPVKNNPCGDTLVPVAAGGLCGVMSDPAPASVVSLVSIVSLERIE